MSHEAIQGFVNWLPQQAAPGMTGGHMGTMTAEYTINHDREALQPYLSDYLSERASSFAEHANALHRAQGGDVLAHDYEANRGGLSVSSTIREQVIRNIDQLNAAPTTEAFGASHQVPKGMQAQIDKGLSQRHQEIQDKKSQVSNAAKHLKDKVDGKLS